MQPFDTTTYELLRKPDNTIVRVFGNGHEEQELTQEQHQYNVDFHQQIVDNSQAQLDKLAAFELENPPFEIDPEAASAGTAPDTTDEPS